MVLSLIGAMVTVAACVSEARAANVAFWEMELWNGAAETDVMNAT